MLFTLPAAMRREERGRLDFIFNHNTNDERETQTWQRPPGRRPPDYCGRGGGGGGVDDAKRQMDGGRAGVGGMVLS